MYLYTVSYLQFGFVFCEIAILFDYAFCSFEKMLFGAIIPPVNQITIQIKLTSLIVEAVRDLMADHKANCAVIHVSGTIGREKHSL